MCRSIFTFLLVSSAFLVGFYLGKEKILAKIPEFQADSSKEIEET